MFLDKLSLSIVKWGVVIVLGIGSLMAIPTNDIQEDSPDWDCTSMGNMVCGPDLST